MPDEASPLAIARLDAAGRLIDAEPLLSALNSRAGGRIGAPLAVPGIAALASLSHRLGIHISRAVVAADGETELDLWVRAGPDRGGVRLEVSGWRPRAAWRPATDPDRERDFFRTYAELRWETDASLRLTFVSPDAGAQYGFDPRTMLGQPLTRLFALAQDMEGQLPILSAVSARARFDGQRAEVRGTGQWVQLEARPRSDPAGRFAGFVGAAHGAAGGAPAVARGTAASVSIPQLTFPPGFARRLERALQGPLARIIAAAEAIADAESDAPVHADYVGYAADIAGAGRHLLALVEDLADLQSAEQAALATASEAVDLADIARRAAALLAIRASDAGIAIAPPPAKAMLRVTGDFRRVLQVLVNLIGNAVRYSPSGGTVRITLEQEDGIGRVVIADQGKGIPARDHERIFEKFARLDPAEPGGSGLGLYIARRLARAMGGDLTVESAPAMGARFLLSLPLRD